LEAERCWSAERERVNSMRRLVISFTVLLAVAAPGRTQTAPAHDLTGVWRWTSRVLTVSSETPPMTPEGTARFKANKPSYRPRAVPPALGNDPQGKCDPLGIPRLLFYGGTTAVEFIQTADRVVEFFEWMHVYRTIWTDGRKLPEDPDPSRLGYSIGRWDGDTLVVNSAGFVDSTWVDHFGDPHSDQMRIEERYRRTSHDALEMTLTLIDPKIYTRPWVSDKKEFRLEPKTELQEIFCVPSEEEAFNRRMRDPAAGKVSR
jgi:hypothetical protein